MAACAAFDWKAKYPQSPPLTEPWRYQFVSGRESARAEMANENQGLTPLLNNRLGAHRWGNKRLWHLVDYVSK